MQAPGTILSELETAIQTGSGDKRLDALRQVTDLFLIDCERLNESQNELFDDVLVRLVRSVESKALAELSTRLAPIDNAPQQVIQRLARADEIAVAGPVLSHSKRLASSDLIEIARSKSQDHMLAISGRPRLEAAVTDVLVDRGNSTVVGRLVKNAGAAFSEAGFSALTVRAERDQSLLEGLGRRADLPPKLFRELLLKATDIVRDRLLAYASPERRAVIERLLDKISQDVGRESGVGKRREEAERKVQRLEQDGLLSISSIYNFAAADDFEGVRAAIAALCAVPFELVDRLVRSQRSDGLLILFKAVGLDLRSVITILQMRSYPQGASELDLEQVRTDYIRLSASTAGRVVRFWKIRYSAAPQEPGRGIAIPAGSGS